MLRLDPACCLPPLPLHGSAASRTIEQAALAGLPPHHLMQRAAHSVAALARALQPHARRVWVACGPGNNGGDGLLAAALLRTQLPQTQVTVSWQGDAARLPDDARHALQQARAAGLEFCAQPPEDFDLGIDALLGLGGRGLGAGPMADWMRVLQRTRATVLCVDLPSGLDCDSGAWLNPFEARPMGPRHTLSLLTLKPGLFTADGRDAAGQVWLDRLGVACDLALPDAWLNTGTEPGPTRQQRHGAHKGSHGDLLVLGGQDVSVDGNGMSGAALLAARAGLQAGAGRVYLGLLGAGPATPALDPLWPELMFRPAQASAEGELARQATTVCGCGGGQSVRAVLPALLEQSPRLVLDADALNALAQQADWRAQLSQRLARGQYSILTPHPLEAARLLGYSSTQVQANRLQAARQLAQQFQCVVVLKGSGSVIAVPGQSPFINPTGNALLATAGTGDVLAGMVGAYWAQNAQAQRPDRTVAVMPFHGLDSNQDSGLLLALQAACQAAWQHGTLADRWPQGRGLRAGDLLADLTPWPG
ncbi:NAD(P)H-hydrate dehydratase [Malikia granosa]|uniref:ADP-dependent (S)-NAD(P)H-hydrate dehydratase n=1 Tax=Malikia granosa TaxID=263067 RepID=A0A2S9K1V9_9BURK|nr:NAD(P)H-hydrate dehydratase [Malikia granosa]PRD64440.1 bifunctional ADP-dependent NAD(P)H-hydrate dehydratase/NAD(P)H-hydrate epimerase [Malikia granosa]